VLFGVREMLQKKETALYFLVGSYDLKKKLILSQCDFEIFYVLCCESLCR
jgi:hypothetical protein